VAVASALTAAVAAIDKPEKVEPWRRQTFAQPGPGTALSS